MACEVSEKRQGTEAQFAEEEGDETIVRLDKMFGAMERGITEAWGDRDRSYAGPVWDALRRAKHAWVEGLGLASDTAVAAAVPAPGSSNETFHRARADLWEMLHEQGPRLSTSKAFLLLKSTEDVKREFDRCASREQNNADDPVNRFCTMIGSILFLGLVMAVVSGLAMMGCVMIAGNIWKDPAKAVEWMGGGSFVISALAHLFLLLGGAPNPLKVFLDASSFHATPLRGE